MKKSALTLKFSRKCLNSKLSFTDQLNFSKHYEFPKEADCTLGDLSGGALGMNTQEKMAEKELKQNWVERS